MLNLFLQTTSASEPQSGAGSLLVFLPLIAVFYFFMIRPRQKQMRAHNELMRVLEVGDEVETVAGMFGTITRTADDVIWVELAPGLTVKMARGAIRRKVVQTGQEEVPG